MKISEMSTEQLAPVLADLAEPLSDIANDESTMEALKRIAAEKTSLTQVAAFVKEIFPLLLKTHFESTCKIVAILTGKTLEQIKTQKGLQTIADAVAVFDDDLMDFFKSFVHTEQTK